MSKDEKQKIAFRIGARAGKDFHALVELINLPESDLWSRITAKANEEEAIRKQEREARRKVLDELLDAPLKKEIRKSGGPVFDHISQSSGKSVGKTFKTSIAEVLAMAGKIAVGNYAYKIAPGVLTAAIKEQEIAAREKIIDEFEKISIPEDIAKHYIGMDFGWKESIASMYGIPSYMSERFVQEPTFLFEIPFATFKRLPEQFKKSLRQYNLTIGAPRNRFNDGYQWHTSIASITCTQFQFEKFVKEIEDFDQCLARDFRYAIIRKDNFNPNKRDTW